MLKIQFLIAMANHYHRKWFIVGLQPNIRFGDAFVLVAAAVVVVVVVVEIFVHGAVKATVTNAPQSQLNK